MREKRFVALSLQVLPKAQFEVAQPIGGFRSLRNPITGAPPAATFFYYRHRGRIFIEVFAWNQSNCLFLKLVNNISIQTRILYLNELTSEIPFQETHLMALQIIAFQQYYLFNNQIFIFETYFVFQTFLKNNVNP